VLTLNRQKNLLIVHSPRKNYISTIMLRRSKG